MLNIEGWASKYNVDDDEGEILIRGVFTKSLRDPRHIPMLFDHNKDAVIGKWTNIKEKQGGLWVEGIVTNEDIANMISRGEIKGLSVGYQERAYRKDYDTGYKTIERAILHEISISSTPINLYTQIARFHGRE